MKTISVIIPNYNNYSYSEKCLRALENQTFKDFDVTIIDDCSTDDSYEKFVKYAGQSPLSINVIKLNSNKGPGHARKIGIESTESEWVAFCDIDDWYDDDFLEIQLENADRTESDLVLCDHKYVYGNGTTVKAGVTDWCKKTSISKRTILAYAKMSMCRLLAKRTLFDGIIMPEIYFGEDAPITIQLIVNAKKIFVDCEAHYNYLIREDSASASINPRAATDYLQAYRIIQKTIAFSFPEECSFIGTNMVLYGATLIMLKADKDFDEVKRITDEFEKSFPKWHKNKYIQLLDNRKKAYLWALKHRLIIICKCYAKLHSYLISKQARG